MDNPYVTKMGQLRDSLKPAMYFDSSVLIDYWLAEGVNAPRDTFSILRETNENPAYPIIREIMKSETRMSKMGQIREKVYNSRVTPVASPFCLLELMEWQAEAAFKQMASEAVGVTFVQNRGKKQIGDYLKKALELRTMEIAGQRNGEKCSGSSTGLEILMLETWLNESFVREHGLHGILLADVLRFDFSAANTWSEASAYAFLQLGGADILHILLARHLGCQYLASFDDDFRRVRDILKDESQLELLSSPEEILAIL